MGSSPVLARFVGIGLVLAGLFIGASLPAAANGQTIPAVCQGVRVVNENPKIYDCPIPFSQKRRAETAAYSQRHYGVRTFHLRRPRVIVEHYTGGNSFLSAYRTFAANVRDLELRELPGVCAHFAVDTDGSIYRLVPPNYICRHTVGLNWTAIGIEHVGENESAIFSRRSQLLAGQALTNWLRCSFQIAVENVIGHNESLSSPFHRERVQKLRRQTHGDFLTTYMAPYRSMLGQTSCPSQPSSG